VALWVGIAVLVAVVVAGGTWFLLDRNNTDGSPGQASTSTRAPSSSSGRPSTEPADKTKVIAATDNKSELTVPSTWTDLPAAYRNDVAVIQQGEARREQYAMVITDDKSDFTDFAAFEKAVLEGTKSLLEAVEVGERSDLTVGDLPAAQYEVKGTVEGTKIVYWFTMVNGSNGYYQVITWTLPSRQDEAKPVFDKVVDSFKETP
jgi:hypothetical protein